ncbi:MAG: hypothetical protein Ct9H300mP11_04870 [Chloroflexota bacterium]|nr:MAG: hypothetical protein Ct9H300mP11_04870 [Chloroflexota bacterium]
MTSLGSYSLAWLISLAASLGGMVAIITMESTKRELVPEWEDDLPADAREPVIAPSAADD